MMGRVIPFVLTVLKEIDSDLDVDPELFEAAVMCLTKLMLIKLVQYGIFDYNNFLANVCVNLCFPASSHSLKRLRLELEIIW